MRGAILPSILALTVVLASCASDAGEAAGPATTDTVSSTSTTDPAATDGPAGQLVDQYGVRYCEVLAIRVADTGTTAEVWGTQGLNDCPQDDFTALDPAAIAAEMGATLALRNGPRYWMLDRVVVNELAGSGEIRDLGGIEMRSIATVDLGPGIPDRSPYRESSVARDTEFVFDAGRTVHELTAPDGSVYVMQSYSLEIDPTLTAAALGALGDRLQLPEGWTFASRVLDEPLVVEDVDGVATVLQDELRNSYQLRRRG